jgi:hypothetical protein
MHVLSSSAHADDNSGPGGLLQEEIPGILNVGADREPLAGEITIRQPKDLDREVYLVHQSGPEFLCGIAGYLGIASLEAKEITFDFERNELSWKM